MIGNWYGLEPCVTITPFSLESLGGLGDVGGSGIGGTATAQWLSADLVLLYPIVLEKPITAVSMFTLNGTTANGNIDVGIYDKAGTRIVHNAAAAQAGTSAIQSFNIADTTFGPGLFYMAITMSSTTGTLFRATSGVTQDLNSRGMAQATSTGSLPPILTYSALSTANNFVPVFGINTRGMI